MVNIGLSLHRQEMPNMGNGLGAPFDESGDKPK
jgi:hypothetical protein